MSNFLKLAQEKGIGRFTDGMEFTASQMNALIFKDSLPTLTPNNVGIPSNILTQTMTQAVEIITQKRTAEEVIGNKTKLMDFAKEKGQFPLKERTASVDVYSDFGDAPYAGLNLDWGDVRNYRFSSSIVYGDLQVEQHAEAKINYVNEVTTGATEAIAIEFNRTGFNGFIKDGNFVVYGVLNTPQLKAYETIAKTWDTASFDEIKADISKLMSLLTVQSGGNVNTAKDKIRISLPSDKLIYLRLTTTSLGITLMDQLMKVFPNVEWVGAPELKGAYTGNKDVMIIVAENSIGGTPDTSCLGFSELLRVSRLEQKTTAVVQKMSAGSNGANFFKPTFCVRAQGI